MKTAERVLAAGGLFGAVLLLVTLFLPWHAVHVVNWGGAFCWAPDCHADVYTEASASICTGYTHLGFAALVLVVALAALEILLLSRPAMRRRWVVAVALLALALAAIYADFAGSFLVHLFDKVETRYGALAFDGVLLAVFGIAVAQVVLTLVAARRARREERAARAAAGIPEPSPEIRRREAGRLLDRTGRPLALLGFAAAAILAVVVALPWHRVPDVFEECMWGSPPAGCPTDLAAAPQKLCTGLDHHGGFTLVILGAVLVLQTLLASRSNMRRRWIPTLVLGALVAGFVLLFFDPRLPHPFFVGEDLGREGVYDGIAWVLAVAAVLQLAAAMLGARLGRAGSTDRSREGGDAGPTTGPR